jgi:hypothetical protein
MMENESIGREEWASIIKKAKAKLKGPSCYRKKKNKLVKLLHLVG